MAANEEGAGAEQESGVIAALPEPEGEPALADASSDPSDSLDVAEVTVEVARSRASHAQRSAEAVSVVDTRVAQSRSASLGEVLARTQGVAVRRGGGLGSESRFSLNGLYDDQIRFFFDGVPLELAGYPFGIADVPVGLVERVEVYRGVVPVRFGADALGGAVNLVSDQGLEPRIEASYQVGSFGTHRWTLDGYHGSAESPFFARGSLFLDLAENNYPVEVEVADPSGRLAVATVPRFHDAYRAYGSSLELGWLDLPWAKRLAWKGFAASYEKELQHNQVMTIPYGEVSYGESVGGMTLRYEVAPAPALELELLASYARRRLHFVDRGRWVYDWYGRRIRERRVGGEIGGGPADQVVAQDGAFARAQLTWLPASGQDLRWSVSPSYTTRTGDERAQSDPAARDPLGARHERLTLVSGIEHEARLLGERLATSLFVKDYVYRVSGEEALAGDASLARETRRHRQGMGGSLRFELSPGLQAKASYEYATRLPNPEEVFGDGILVRSNLQLEPETSHNANLGPRIELEDRRWGNLAIDVNLFLRDSERLIVLLGSDRSLMYQNVYHARGFGLESGLTWEALRRYLSFEGAFTWQSVRNASGSGTFGEFAGDRIPNRPYLFASWGSRLRLGDFPGPLDSLEPFYSGRYVHEFFRTWESQGRQDLKQIVGAQVTHGAGISWLVERYPFFFTMTLEVENLTDARVFDNFGTQRPGRSFSWKWTGRL